MTVDILQMGPLAGPVQQRLGAAFSVHRYWEAADREALLTQVGPMVRGVATSGEVGCARGVIERLPALEVISCYGVGYDGIDVAAARERKVRVTNTPEVLNDAVAEMTLGLMLALSRRIVEADRFVRAGRWPDGGFGLAAELTGKTVGILGLGRIGKEIARRLQAFKMQVVYHGRTEQAHEPYPYYADLEAMARDVDWLVVIAPGTASTKGLVSRRVLELLGPAGRLVNIARGSLIDEPALVELLSSGGLGGAALDVFVDEPRVPDALFGLDTVVLSPHQGSATEKTRAAMGNLMFANLEAHFAGRPLLTPVA